MISGMSQQPVIIIVCYVAAVVIMTERTVEKSFYLNAL